MLFDNDERTNRGDMRYRYREDGYRVKRDYTGNSNNQDKSRRDAGKAWPRYDENDRER